MDNQSQQAYADQTEPAWISNYRFSTGTGLYLTPNSSSSRVETSILYDDFVLLVRSNQTPGTVLKWIPEEVSSYNDLLATPCIPRACESSCAEYGCICDSATKTCIGI